MPNCYYTCNLLPLDLVARRGFAPHWLGNYLLGPNASTRRAALSVHPMTCPYVTKLVAAADRVLSEAALGSPDVTSRDCFVVPGGCDAMRRLGDLLAVAFPERVFVLPMPRSSGPAVAATLASDLCRLDEWLRSRLPEGAATATAAAAKPVDAATESADAGGRPVAYRPTVDYPVAPRPGGVFLVAGPLSNDSLLRLIDSLGSHVSGLESCTSPGRWGPLTEGLAAETGGAGGKCSDTTGASRAAGAASAGAGPDHLALANKILSVGMCPRRSTADRRAYLLQRFEETRPSSVIYARQSFCDPGAYDALLVSQVAQERGLPYLEIEVDFPFDAGGPLRTRVEAFLEAQLLGDDLLDGDPDDGLFDNDPGAHRDHPAAGTDDLPANPRSEDG